MGCSLSASRGSCYVGLVLGLMRRPQTLVRTFHNLKLPFTEPLRGVVLRCKTTQNKGAHHFRA
jgi:hypothetical protein